MKNILRAAFGKVKLTPEEHAPLQGYSPITHIADPDKDILDDIYARVVILDDGSVRKVLVSVDCCLTNEVPFLAASATAPYRYLDNTFPEGTRQQWGDAAGIEEASVSVHATHTHSSPAYFSRKYTSRITAKIREMLAELQPIQVKAAASSTEISVIRRPNLRPNNELSIDRSLNVILFEKENGEPLGAIVNCAVHPTRLMHPLNRVSSEFVGLAMSEWESSYGHSFVSLFIQGFGGDVGPAGHYRDEKDETYPKVKELSMRLVQDIKHACTMLSPVIKAPLISSERKVSLPTRDGFYKPFVTLTLHALRLGDIVLLSASGEIFNGYVNAIRSQSPFPHMLFSGVANGYNGYLPTQAAFQDGLGGYEMNATPYSEQACDQFISEALALITSVSARQ